MNRPRLSRPVLLTAAGLLGAVACAAPAAAASSTVLPTDVTALPRGGAVEYGEIDLKLGGGAKAKLSGKVSGSGGASVKGSTISFDPVDRGSALDVTQMVGTVPAKGSLTIRGSKGSARLTQITFNPGGSGKDVTAKLGSKLIELGTLKGGKATFSKQSDGVLKNAKLSLSAKAAKAINAKSGAGLSAGTLGTVTIDVTGRELPLKDGTAVMTFDPSFLSLLASNGMAITATPPAVLNGNAVTIQLTGGAFDPEGLTGRLALEGKVTIGKPGLSVDLFGWRAIVSKKQHDLYANVNESVSAPIADLDVSALSSTIVNGVFESKGAKISLSKIAVDTLKQNFAVVIPEGTPLGTVDISGHLSGA